MDVGWILFLAKVILLYKMINGLCPDYLSSLVPSTVGSNTVFNLSNASDYKYIRSNTPMYYNSFFPSVVHNWNELPKIVSEYDQEIPQS